jgi:hypothetical protein
VGSVINKAIIKLLLYLTLYNTSHIVWVMNHNIGTPASLLYPYQGTNSIGDFIIIIIEVVRVTYKVVL